MNTSNITNYKPKDFAELLGVSVKTLQRWDREGTLKANRTPTDRRYYTYDQYLQFKGINIENDQRQVVIYARVSTRNQKDDLKNQVAFLRQFCNAKGIIVDQCIEDYGSGLNYNRKKWNELLDEVMKRKIKTIIVTHKDRFIRFGYELKDRFTAEPLATLESMKESYPQLASLTSAQLQYVANSDYINRNFSSLLREEPQKFVDNVCQRATEIDKVTSKNGYFVEVNFCEQWTDKPIVNDGAIMHPKVADTIIKQGETQARGLKAKAEAVGEYFPYTKCSLSVFHAEKGNIDNVFKTRVDIGDGYQTSLVDHMKQISSASPILAGFEKATREQGAKEKIMFNSTHREEVVAEQTEKTGALSDRAMSREEWGNEIASAKQAEANNSREDNEPQKNTRSKTEMEKG